VDGRKHAYAKTISGKQKEGDMMDFIEAAKKALNGEIMERESINRTKMIMFSDESGAIKFRKTDYNGIHTEVSEIDLTSDWQPHEEHFDLSKKAKDILSNRTGEEWTGIYYPESDIKEFIKQINIEMKREDSGIGVIDYARASVIIDNLAGERFK